VGPRIRAGPGQSLELELETVEYLGKTRHATTRKGEKVAVSDLSLILYYNFSPISPWTKIRLAKALMPLKT